MLIPQIPNGNPKPNIVEIVVNGFTEQDVGAFRSQFFTALDAEQNYIPIYIDSYGGFVDSAIAMHDIIKTVERPEGTVVATICLGKAMSAGAFLVAAGDPGYRYCSTNSRIMIHAIRGVAWGEIDEVLNDAEEMKKLNQRFLRLMALSCGQPVKYFFDLLNGRNKLDFYMTAITAKRHKIIDHIGLPRVTAPSGPVALAIS